MPEAYMGKEYKCILSWLDNGIGYLQFNRPKAFNAVNSQLLVEAADCLNMMSA